MDTRTGSIYTSEEIAEQFSPKEMKYFIPVTNPTTGQIRRKKIGRNEPCPCGSGLKFKKCHLGKEVTE